MYCSCRLALLLLCQLTFIESVSATNWSLAAEYTQTTNANLLVVDDLVSESYVRVSCSDGYNAVQKTPFSRGLGGVFLFEGPFERGRCRVELKALFDSGLSPDLSLKSLFIDKESHEYSAVKKLSESLQLWASSDAEKLNDAFELISASLPLFKEGSDWHLKAMAVHVWMALYLEKFHELKRLDLKVLGVQDEHKYVRLLSWALAALHDTQGDWREAYLRYHALTEMPSRTKVDELNHNEILAQELRIQLILKFASFNAKEKDDLRIKLFSARDAAIYYKDYRLVGQLENVVSLYFDLNKQRLESEKSLLSAEKNYRLAGDNKGLTDVLNNQTRLYQSLGKTDKALGAISEALEIEKQHLDTSGKAYLLLMLSQVYQDVGRNFLAELYGKLALEIFLETGDSIGIGGAKHEVGQVLRANGKAGAAFNLHFSTLDGFDLNQEIEPKDIRTWVELIYSLLDMGNIQDASKIAKRLETYFFQTDSTELQKLSRQQYQVLSAIQSVALKDSDVATYRRLNRIFEKSLLAEVESELPHTRLMHSQRELEYILLTGDFSNYKLISSKALDLINKIHDQVSGDFLGPAWSHKSSPLIELYVKVLLRSRNSVNAKSIEQSIFDLLESTQAVSYRHKRLKTLQRRKDAQFPSSIDRDIVEAISLESSITQSDDREYVNSIISESSLKKLSNLKRASSKKRQPLKTIELKEIISRLGKNELVLRYFVRDNISLVFQITHQGWSLKEIGDKSKISGLLKLHNDEVLNQGDMIKTKLAEILNLKKYVSSGIDKITIVADGPLNGLAFSSVNISARPGDYVSVASKFEVLRVYSLSQYFSSSDTGKFLASPQSDIVVFADPLFSKGELAFNPTVKKITTEFTMRSWVNGLEPLPATRLEANSIKKTFSDKSIHTITGNAATAKALMDDSSRNARVLHIASHGYFNENTPGIVGIATSSEKGGAYLLTLTEMLSKPFWSNLVVVSGCETNVGTQFDGEGQTGLARGLLSNGAGSVVGTLWPIPDKPTASFMKEFYTGLRLNGGNSSQALAYAKRQFIESDYFSSPYFWSGFILTSADSKSVENVFH